MLFKTKSVSSVCSYCNAELQNGQFCQKFCVNYKCMLLINSNSKQKYPFSYDSQLFRQSQICKIVWKISEIKI